MLIDCFRGVIVIPMNSKEKVKMTKYVYMLSMGEVEKLEVVNKVENGWVVKFPLTCGGHFNGMAYIECPIGSHETFSDIDSAISRAKKYCMGKMQQASAIIDTYGKIMCKNEELHRDNYYE